MTAIRIEGIPPWDGDYPINIADFTTRELHFIKQLSDVRGAELPEEFSRGNVALIMAVVLVAAKRAGKEIPPDVLWEASPEKYMLVREEDDASPPLSSISGASPAGNETSGSVSNGTGEPLATLPSRIGDPGLASAAESDLTPSAA